MAPALSDPRNENAPPTLDQATQPVPGPTTWIMPQCAPHPQAAEILRQVEYYFSDENLPSDAHLLGLTGSSGTGPVSLNQILGSKKMRQYKPKTAVREALRLSNLIEVLDAKYIRRKVPLTLPLTVVPQVNEQKRSQAEIMSNNPGMTKGMMKPTGFEPNATPGPITPAEYDEEREIYDADNNIGLRIEHAINRFCMRHKFHQETRQVFEKFMMFGGIDHSTAAFQGGMTKDQMKKEGFSKAEIEQSNAYYGISESVQDSIYAEQDGVEDAITWVVDFEGLAKAFLSSQFMSYFNWYDTALVPRVTTVLRRFYNYLITHDVCPEYDDQLRAALSVCDIADEELPKLASVDQHLPGTFNIACSTLYEGSYAGLHQNTTFAWSIEGDDIGLSDKEATNIFNAGIAAYGTDEQFEQANSARMAGGAGFSTVSSEQIGLEVVAVKPSEGDAKLMYDNIQTRYPYVKPMGKLICKRWSMPYAPPSDLPSYATKLDGTFDFFVEDATLAFCYPGIKFEAVVKELNIGVKWLDRVEKVFPSFYTWLPNESIREWREPGPPKGWMERQTRRAAGVVDYEGGGGVEVQQGGRGGEDDEYEDDEPE